MFRASTIGMALVALAPFDPAARQAPNTFVGTIGRAGWAYMAVVTRGERALIYLCDGRASEWFGASIRGGRLLVRSFNGTVVGARVQAGAVRGTVQPRGQSAVRSSPHGRAGRGSGSSRAQTPIIIGETSTTPVGDGSVRTINPTTTAPATTTTPSSISDGTSNTIVLGVDPINGIAAGASPPPIPPAPPVTTCPVLQPCPPALPASITAAPSGVKTIGLTPGGQPNLLPGGGLIDCGTLTALIASLAAAAKQGDAAAIKQLGVLLAQAEANRC